MLNLLLATTLTAVQAFACLLVADFATGFMHWAEDTWLRPGWNPLLDRWIVEPNIEHHRRPGAIREGSYWETNGVTIALAASVAAAFAAAGIHGWQAYLVLLIASQANQIHAWGHTASPPEPVAWLQRIGLFQSAAQHAVHHKRPYGVRYCTTTNFLNPILDGSGFWRHLEALIESCGPSVYRATPARNGY